jgi:hypothetical protein
MSSRHERRQRRVPGRGRERGEGADVVQHWAGKRGMGSAQCSVGVAATDQIQARQREE